MAYRTIHGATHKYCKPCDTWYPATLHYFYSDINCKNDLSSYCQDCQRAAAKGGAVVRKLKGGVANKTLLPPETKYCKKCAKIHPRSNYFKNKTYKDGLSYYCKGCHTASVKEWKQKHPEQAKEKQREQSERYLQRRAVKLIRAAQADPRLMRLLLDATGGGVQTGEGA